MPGSWSRPPYRLQPAAALAVLALLTSLLALAPAERSGAQEVGSPGEIVERDTSDGLVRTFRFRGTDRFNTGRLIAREAFGTADQAIVARGDLFPDSLSGHYLAGQLGAPVLLTPTSQLDDDTLAALEELEVEQVTLLGATDAISAGVQSDLEARGYAVRRIGGIDRYETAADIVTRPGNTVGALGNARATAFVASGNNFPDALVTGAVAYDRQFPVLLTYQDHLPEATRAALEQLDIDSVIIPGGTGPVAATVQAELEAMDITVTRIAGPTRVDTALAFAEFTIERFGWTYFELVFSRGDDFADALTVGPRQGSKQQVLLLTNTPNNVGQPNLDFLDGVACQVNRVGFTGGYAAITDPAEQQIRQAATPPEGACGPPTTITLAPQTATNFVGEPHTVTATVTGQFNRPFPGVEVAFTTDETGTVQPEPESATVTTDEDGQAIFTVGSDTPGVATITACFSPAEGGPVCDSATKTWQYLILTPDSATNEAGQAHTVTATLVDREGNPAPDVAVGFTVTPTDGAPTPRPPVGEAVTDRNGQASFEVSSDTPGTVVIEACFEPGEGEPAITEEFECDSATKTWQ
ncbi:MAG TPA: cell wall-binding repeat-containing protein [Egibacteraceae bacterium]|nr:cell wall-binding repeat-containing protein [Actinomycetota bacterium]HWB73239.1 cell wall-binding repeat-containing protein [Egibacteraceae bacterium]